MKNILTAKSFWFSAVIATVVIFVFGMNINKTYKGEMELLLLPKSENTARNIEQIMNNAKEIPKSLTFYNKLIELNSDIEDKFSNLSDNERRSSWNAKIKVNEIKKSTIIKINVLDETEWQAELVSRQTAQSLVTVLNKYYNTQQTDLDIKTIDGPVVSRVSKINFLKLLVFSLIVGLIFGSLISSLLKIIDGDGFSLQPNLTTWKEYFKPNNKNDGGEIFPDYSPDASNETKLTKEDIFKSEPVYQFEKKGSAPDNLPVAVDEPVFIKQQELEPKGETEEEPMEQIMAKTKKSLSDLIKGNTREASPEEIKARLNKLLNG